MSTPVLPTRRCRVIDVDNAMDEIRAFLDATPEGERKWCEVVYPGFLAGVDESFDAVELVDGEIVTLPPYAEIVAAYRA